MNKNKSKVKRNQNLLPIIQTITMVIVGIATIWSFVNSKQIQDRLIGLDELKLMPEIQMEMIVDSVINCNNEIEEMTLITITNNGHKIKKVINVRLTPFLTLNTQIKKVDTTLFTPLNTRICTLNFNKSDGIIYTLKSEILFDKFDKLKSDIESVCKTIKGEHYYRYMGNIELSYFLSIYYQNFIGEYIEEYYSIGFLGNRIREISKEQAKYYENSKSLGIPNSIDSINPSKLAELCLFDMPDDYNNFWISGNVN